MPGTVDQIVYDTQWSKFPTDEIGVSSDIIQFYRIPEPEPEPEPESDMQIWFESDLIDIVDLTDRTFINVSSSTIGTIILNDDNFGEIEVFKWDPDNASGTPRQKSYRRTPLRMKRMGRLSF
jgi:hypothetical protein